MSVLSQFLSGGGYIVRQHTALLTSSSITVERNGIALVFLVGGGGSGGQGGVQGVSAKLRATGGGAGECAFDFFRVTAGDTITATIGAGGASGGTLGTNAAGNAGTVTTVAGPSGYTITANPGQGGVLEASLTLAGGAGGSGGTGGSSNAVRYEGGRGGSIIQARDDSRATGGGGVNVFGRTAQTGTAGGDITGYSGSYGCATGGGGSGAPGVQNAGYPSTGGGGAGTHSLINTINGGPNYVGGRDALTGTVIFCNTLGIPCFDGGGSPNFIARTGNGSGGGGQGHVSTATPNILDAGVFGGSGGLYLFGTSYAIGGIPGQGGGSGAAVSIVSGGSTYYGALAQPGGGGLAIIAILQQV